MFLSDLYNIRYLLLLELSLLAVFAFFELIPFLILLGVVILSIIIYVTYHTPVLAYHILIFSILLDAVLPYKNISSGPSLFIQEILFGAFLAVFTVKFLTQLNEDFKIPSFIWLWIPFFIWTLPTGLLIALEKLRILVFWKNYFGGFFSLVLLYYAIENRSQVKALILAFIMWGFILALIEFNILMQLGGFSSSIVGLYFKKNLFAVSWGRSNYLASFFVVIIPLTFGYLFYTKSIKLKLFLSITLLFMFLGIILPLSRGGLLTLLITLVILFSRTLRARSLVPFTLISAIVITIILLNPLTYKIAEGMSAIETSGSVYSRLNFYEDTWNAFLKHPFTGVGFGNLSFYATFILAKDASSSAHNIILGMLGETGIIGSLFFFSILIIVFIKVFKDYISEKDKSIRILKWAFISSLSGGFIHSLMEPNFEGLQFSIIFWGIAATFFHLNKLKSNHPLESEFPIKGIQKN